MDGAADILPAQVRHERVSVVYVKNEPMVNVADAEIPGKGHGQAREPARYLAAISWRRH